MSKNNAPRSNALYVNRTDTALGRVIGAGTTFMRGPHLHPSMHILGEYALVYILRGNGIYHNARGHSQRFAPGDVIVIFPELGHQYGPDSSEDFEEFFIIFTGPLFDVWQSTGLLDPARPIFHLEPIHFWMEKLRHIIAEPPNDSAAIFRSLSLLCDFLIEAHIASGAKAATSSEAPWLAHARVLLGENLAQHVDAAEVAHALNLSYDAFRRQFRRQMGVSPARYRMNQRITAAGDLLMHTSISIRQIAESLGFYDEFHFSQKFKQLKGVSPREFRRLQ